jgi:putative endonuclease
MFTVYVLRSLKNEKRYVGFTSKELSVRLDWHRSGLTAWTKQNNPFELIHSEEYQTKHEAMRREKYFKTGQGRRTLDLLTLKSSVSAKKHGGPATNSGGG